jgi:hypothetical protein
MFRHYRFNLQEARNQYFAKSHKYSGTSVHEFNSFLEAVRHPQRS